MGNSTSTDSARLKSRLNHEIVPNRKQHLNFVDYKDKPSTSTATILSTQEKASRKQSPNLSGIPTVNDQLITIHDTYIDQLASTTTEEDDAEGNLSLVTTISSSNYSLSDADEELNDNALHNDNDSHPKPKAKTLNVFLKWKPLHFKYSDDVYIIANFLDNWSTKCYPKVIKDDKNKNIVYLCFEFQKLRIGSIYKFQLIVNDNLTIIEHDILPKATTSSGNIVNWFEISTANFDYHDDHVYIKPLTVTCEEKDQGKIHNIARAKSPHFSSVSSTRNNSVTSFSKAASRSSKYSSEIPYYFNSDEIIYPQDKHPANTNLNRNHSFYLKLLSLPEPPLLPPYLDSILLNDRHKTKSKKQSSKPQALHGKNSNINADRRYSLPINNLNIADKYSRPQEFVEDEQSIASGQKNKEADHSMFKRGFKDNSMHNITESMVAKSQTTENQQREIVPTHVMLNHLITSNISNDIIHVSVIHRYQGKYITTILYTPVDS
ncbi:hypothetical protein PP7435_CHR1-0450 [Komagataella phaffii CBS 7435]|uniref:Association with the SNF1 complex (ASC) domain-containing protein n=2 Tax=Komagataella phaffii TaxID=460519 RepID=C4QW81_KOMPG|nr:Hypothetical protein PAS_chr1-1_0140 [Komagataella phaffii GS115]AOA60330.1 GQ67_02718T0 [Komagataella phaffii]CAH2446173.1 hypothetical protein BQ9382_C1-2330 [Komagataella phaffii CBS 7435]AOA66888.1 GQ68_02530T0 [Komagataella phaffii GS115]CAY67504.1 Hypothetical protein PAS_chr1-1_0140 [Komagataella phaffii GS115]CCA36603.1 hypothetical protein PP7435_CHR1-0450 [Komagataella phaffii CBS 7435]